MLRRPASVRKMYTDIGQMDIFIPDVPPALTTAKYSTRWLAAISYAWPPTVRSAQGGSDDDRHSRLSTPSCSGSAMSLPSPPDR